MSDKHFACVGNVIKTKNLNRNGRPCSLNVLTLIINHGTYFTVACACGYEVAHLKGTLLNEYGGNGSASLIKLGLDYDTSCFTLGVSFKFKHVCGKKDCLKKIVDTVTALS